MNLINPKTGKKFKNKTNAIMYHLKHIGRLSQKQCTDLYGATRLSGTIFCKREQGYNIKTHLIEGTTDRFGNKVPEYAEYELISEPQDDNTKNIYDDFVDMMGNPIKEIEDLQSSLKPKESKKTEDGFNSGFWNSVKNWFKEDGEK